MSDNSLEYDLLEFRAREQEMESWCANNGIKHIEAYEHRPLDELVTLVFDSKTDCMRFKRRWGGR